MKQVDEADFMHPTRFLKTFSVLAILLTAPCALGAEPEGNEDESYVFSEIQIRTHYPKPLAERYGGVIPFQPGQTVTKAQLEVARKIMESTGLFRSVEMQVAGQPPNRVLTVALWQNETVHSLRIRGNLFLLDSTILSTLEMRRGALFNVDALPKEAERIESVYRQKGWFGTRVTYQYEQSSEDGGVAITYRLERGRQIWFPRVDLEGVHVGNPETIRGILRMYLWLTDERLDKKLKKVERYYGSIGYPAATARVASRQFDASGKPLYLKVEIKEGKKLILEFQGNHHVSDGKLRKATVFNKEGGYSFFQIEESVTSIKGLYEKKGYPFAKVTFRRKITDQEVRVAFTVDEGEKAYLRKIFFEGNDHISTERLMKELKTYPRNLLRARLGIFEEDQWESDIVAIETLYLDEGFLDVSLEFSRRLIEQEKESMILIVKIKEGPRYTVSSVRLEGVAGKREDRVRKAIGIHTGDPFNQVRLNKGIRRIENFYRDQGHLIAEVDAKHDIGEDQKVDISVDVKEGPLIVSSGTVISGNLKTRTSLLRRNVKVPQDEPIDAQNLQRSEKNLHELGVFQSVSLSVGGLSMIRQSPQLFDQPTIVCPVVLQVTEQKALTVEVGGRYDSDYGPEVFGLLEHQNLWDMAHKVSLYGLYGPMRNEASLAYKAPRLFGSSYVGYAQGGRRTDELVAFTKTVTNIMPGIYRTFRKHYTPALFIDAEDAQTFNIASTAPDAPVPAETMNVFIGSEFMLDLRNDPIYPTHGWYVQTRLETSSASVASDDSLVRARFWATHYLQFAPRLLPKWSIATNFRMDCVDSFGSTETIPSTQLLFAGGITTVRGFPLDQLGPLDAEGNPLGGTVRLLGSIELRFPIYYLLHGVAFVDTGSLTPGWGPVTWDTFRWTAGGELCLYSPVGPVSVGYGYQLQPNPPLSRGSIIFSLGFAF